MKLGLTIETVAVLANAIEACKNTFFEKSFAIDIEERTLRH
jgi:hypothetical protein